MATLAEDIRKELNQDILNGEGPDLLVLDGDIFSCATYAGNGFLQDLYPLMDGDDEFHREDYLENILSAYELNGKLYGFISTFTIYTAFTSRDYLDASAGCWELIKLLERKRHSPQRRIPHEPRAAGGNASQRHSWGR